MKKINHLLAIYTIIVAIVTLAVIILMPFKVHQLDLLAIVGVAIFGGIFTTCYSFYSLDKHTKVYYFGKFLPKLKKEVVEETNREQQAQYRDLYVQDFLEELNLCSSFTELLALHRKIVDYGFSFNTSNSWNFSNKEIQDVKLKDLNFYSYDRDGTIHGNELEEMEINNKNTTNEWYAWSYWVSYQWYWKTLYVRIKYHRGYNKETLPNPETPKCLKEYFH